MSLIETTRKALSSSRSGIRRLVDVRPGEAITLAVSALYFFCLLASYGVLRPVREAMGLSGGADKLPWLFTGTMLAMILVNPAFAWLVTRTRRRVFVPTVYAVSIACLLGLWLAFETVEKSREIWVAYAFFVFVSVFNLFVVSVFWGFMADLWRLEQAKRLYGVLGAGGTAGMIVGPQLASWLPARIGTVNLIFVSVGFLCVALACIAILIARHGVDTPDDTTASSAEDRANDAGDSSDEVPSSTKTARGGIDELFRGFSLVAQRPYLRWIAAYVLLHGMIGTFLYFQQGNLVDATIASRDERTMLFAKVDVWAQSLTVFVQLFLTSRLIRRFGITFALNSQPVLALVGWCALTLSLTFAPEMAARGWTLGALTPPLAVLCVVQVLLRASNFATVRPAREALFTVVEREVKYKSKSFIDTFVYRFGDAVGGWTFASCQWAGARLPALGLPALGLAGLATMAIPLTALWVVVGRALGRHQRDLSRE